MKAAAALVFLFLSFPSFATSAEKPSAKVVFEQLKTLVGDWKSAKPERSTTINVKLVANGSALVETWTMSPTRQSMTIYTLDGDRLIATHYCPQGNAPRLEWIGTKGEGTYQFEFLDGTNLQDPEGSHEHAFTMRFDSKDSWTRGETYIGNKARYDPKVDLPTEETFVRVR